ncbi:RES family NAD+ phosphorylase [Pontiella sp.]|uniref:RES family NAD+ phosphorylase n=1 Tax=Pontiella sp. TaxID=2837462 RepID=UPI00356811CC
MSITYDAYQTFADKVVNKSRFVLDEESKKFRAFLQDSARKRKRPVGQDQQLVRARKGHAGIENSFFQPYPIEQMLAPPPDKASEGRINPKGIPCFYAADSIETAVSEMRPWIGELISVAFFRPFATLSAIDLTNDIESPLALKICMRKELPASPAEIETQLWSELNHAFSQPVSNTTEVAEYAPTQIISEWLKSWGYDGVVYKSSIHTDGKNYAFFNANLFTEGNEAGMSQIHRVGTIKIKSEPANTILSASNNRNNGK